MHKVKLQVEALVVESFSTCPERAEKGTVVAYADTLGYDATCEGAGCLGETWHWGWTCDGKGTCWKGCRPEEKEDDLIGGTADCSAICTGWGCPP